MTELAVSPQAAPLGAELDPLEQELDLMLEIASDQTRNDHARGLASIRLVELTRAAKGPGVTRGDVARATGQPERSMRRRMEAVRLTAPSSNADLRDALIAGRIHTVDAIALAKRRLAGEPGDLRSLPQLRRERRLALGPREQARLEGFVEGARWAHRALLSEPAHQDWLAQLTHDWVESQR